MKKILFVSITVLIIKANSFAQSVGIGSSQFTPSSTLEIRSTNTTAATFGFKLLNSSSSPMMYIQNDGNVGIGTATASQKLHINAGHLALDNTYAIFFAGSADSNWKIYRNSTADFTKSLVTGASININAFNAAGEGFAIGRNGGNSYYEILGSGPTHYMRGNLGVDVTNPQNKLDVEGSAVIGATYSGTNAAPTNGLLVEGNTGIGTNNPQARLDLFSSTAINAPLLSLRADFTATGKHAMIRFGDQSQTTSYQKGAIIYEGVSGAARGRFHIALENTDGAGNVVLADARATFQSDGNVGIGTTAPIAHLQIKPLGSAAIPAGPGTAPELLVSTTGNGQFGVARFHNPNATSFGSLVAFSNDVSGTTGQGTFIGQVGSNSAAIAPEYAEWAKRFVIASCANSSVGAGSRGVIIDLQGTSEGEQDFRVTQFTNPSKALLTVKQLGNVGINTSAPTSLLHIRSVAGNPTTMLNAYREYNGEINTKAAFIGGTDLGAGGTSTGLYVLEKDNIGFGTSTTSLLRVVLNDNVKMVLNGLGHMGIGTSVPSTRLDLRDAGSAGAVQDLMWMQNTENSYNANSGTGMVAYYGGGHPLFRISGRIQNGGSGAASYMTLSTNTAGTLTEKVWIRTDGNVGIGSGTPGAKLSVAGDIHVPLDNNIFFGAPSIGGSNKAGFIQYNSSMDALLIGAIHQTVAWKNIIIAQAGAGSNVGVRTNTPGVAFQVGVAADGTTASANAWNINSDVRWKKDILPITNGLELVTALQGVTYKWKANDKKDFGFIAQEVEKVLPLAVHTDDKGYKAVDYARITSILVEAVKEQHFKIDSQQKTIDELKNNNQQLKSENTQQENRLQKIEQQLSEIKGNNIQTKK